jgi:diguanylate cyclase (GGDEF)-like protein
LSPELFDIYGRVALTGNPEKLEIDFKPLAKWLSISVYSTRKGYFVAVFDDITERKRYEEKLEHFAVHDQLTGLLNRHSLEDILIRTIAKAKRGAVSSILYMDLDNFKDVNDSVGHSAGDEVLITLAGILKDAVRTEDIVFRLGGDEFAILLDGMDSRESLPAAERLRAIIEAHHFELEGRVFLLSLSIGLIEIDGIVATGELLSQADAAMYRAKAQGKNRVVVA